MQVCAVKSEFINPTNHRHDVIGRLNFLYLACSADFLLIKKNWTILVGFIKANAAFHLVESCTTIVLFDYNFVL